MEKKKLFLYCAAGCILLGLIMSLLDVFSFAGLVKIGMIEDLAVFKILIILLDLVAIAALLLPAFGILAEKASLLRLCAIGAAVLSAILGIIALFVAKNDAGGYLHWTFAGWLLLIFHLGGAALAFLSSKEK